MDGECWRRTGAAHERGPCIARVSRVVHSWPGVAGRDRSNFLTQRGGEGEGRGRRSIGVVPSVVVRRLPVHSPTPPRHLLFGSCRPIAPPTSRDVSRKSAGNCWVGGQTHPFPRHRSTTQPRRLHGYAAVGRRAGERPAVGTRLFTTLCHSQTRTYGSLTYPCGIE